MPILFECACGKRLKAREEIAGRKTRCPQCGRMNTVPPAPPKPTPEAPPADEPPSAVVLVLDDPLAGPVRFALGDAPAPDGGGAEDAGLALDVVLDDEPAPARARPARPAEPAIVESPILAPPPAPRPTISAAPIPLPTPAAAEEPDDAAIEPAPPPTAPIGVLPEVEPESVLAPTSRRRRSSRLEPAEAPTAREPWYVGWAVTLARAILAAALVLSLIVPAFLLVGGLAALAQTGNPRTLADWRLAGVSPAAALLGLWAVIATLALLWAGPVLLLVDQTRRLRVLIARLDELTRLAPSTNSNKESSA
jgi:hypothetical protein